MLWIDADKPASDSSEQFGTARPSWKTYKEPNECLATSLSALSVGHLLAWSGCSLCSRSASPIGLWKGGEATFEVFESEGKLSARIVGLSVPKTAEGKEKTDIYNPDPKKRSCAIIGFVFISGFTKKSDTRWGAAKPIPVLWNCRDQTGSKSAFLLFHPKLLLD